MEHDKFCEYDGWMCICDMLAAARADEREKAVCARCAIRGEGEQND